MIASGELQQKIFTALNGVITGAVYSDVPQGATSPYTVIGETTEVAVDDFSAEGSEETVTLHVWSKQTSDLQVKAILKQVDAALHRKKFTLTGGYAAHTTRDFLQVFKETAADGATWRHGIYIVRATILD